MHLHTHTHTQTKRYLFISSLEEWICLLPSITVSTLLSLAHTDNGTAGEEPLGFTLLEPPLWRGIYSNRPSLTSLFYRGKIRKTKKKDRKEEGRIFCWETI